MNFRKIVLKVANNTPWMMKSENNDLCSSTKDENQFCLAPLNPKALRGLMRFWFRALYYGSPEIGGNLQKLNELENFLFGGQSSSSLVTVKTKTLTWTDSAKKLWSENNDKEWYPLILTGSYRNQKPGPYIGYHKSHENDEEVTKNVNKRYEFEITLLFKENLKQLITPSGSGRESIEEKLYREMRNNYIENPQKYQNYILDSLQALVIFGGCGSRARKGFGSLEVLNVLENGSENSSLSSKFKFADRDSLVEQIQRLKNLSQNYSRPCEITAFSDNAICRVSSPNDGMFVFRQFNDVYKLHRKHCTSHEGGDENGKLTKSLWDITDLENTYKDDIKEAVRVFLKKYMLGLPLTFKPYKDKETGEKKPQCPAKVRAFQGNAEHGVRETDLRRASPLFFSLVRVGDKYCGVITYLRSRFIAENATLRFEYGNNPKDRILIAHDPNLEREYITSIIDGFCPEVQHG
jgi:CRISPR type III-B/RAMP module RAMP protein Cmr1